jgi:hypothetical protein
MLNSLQGFVSAKDKIFWQQTARDKKERRSNSNRPDRYSDLEIGGENKRPALF